MFYSATLDDLEDYGEIKKKQENSRVWWTCHPPSVKDYDMLYSAILEYV